MKHSSALVPVVLQHRLGAALRFVDAFTGVPVAVPLRVLIPELPLVAVHHRGIYRFLATGTPVPAGVFAVAVECASGEYALREPLSVALPRPAVAHPAPALSSDYLIETPLWPTRRLRPPAGETALVGRLASGGATPLAGLAVRLFAAGGPPPAVPRAYADEAGEFLFRLPGLQQSSGVATALLEIEVRSGAAIVAAAPLQVQVPLGVVSFREFEVP